MIDGDLVMGHRAVRLGLDVEQELDGVVDSGYVHIHRRVAERVGEGPKAPRLHPFHGQVPTSPPLEPVGRGRDDLEPLAEVGHRPGVAVMDPLVEHQAGRVRCPSRPTALPAFGHGLHASTRRRIAQTMSGLRRGGWTATTSPAPPDPSGVRTAAPTLTAAPGRPTRSWT